MKILRTSIILLCLFVVLMTISCAGLMDLIYIVEKTTNQDKLQLILPTGHTRAISSACFSPDGRYILSGSGDETMRLWDIITGREVRSFKEHTDRVTSVSFSPDGKYALSGSSDSTMKLWDIATGRKVGTFKGHTDGISSVSFSPDGKYILSGSSDKTLKLWDVNSVWEIRSFRGHTYTVTSLSFSPDGKYALSGAIGRIQRCEKSLPDLGWRTQPQVHGDQGVSKGVW